MLRKTYEVSEVMVIPDEAALIAETIRDQVDRKEIDLVVTTGGTGVGPRDVTPEATRVVMEKELPGSPVSGSDYGVTPFALISRAVCGIRRQ